MTRHDTCDHAQRPFAGRHSTRHGVVFTEFDGYQRFGWSATHEDYDGASTKAWGAVGLGHTEDEAVTDLLEILDHE